jgi:hypothetical protein
MFAQNSALDSKPASQFVEGQRDNTPFVRLSTLLSTRASAIGRPSLIAQNQLLKSASWRASKQPPPPANHQNQDVKESANQPIARSVIHFHFHPNSLPPPADIQSPASSE